MTNNISVWPSYKYRPSPPVPHPNQINVSVKNNQSGPKHTERDGWRTEKRRQKKTKEKKNDEETQNKPQKWKLWCLVQEGSRSQPQAGSCSSKGPPWSCTWSRAWPSTSWKSFSPWTLNMCSANLCNRRVYLPTEVPRFACRLQLLRVRHKLISITSGRAAEFIVL